MYKKLIAVLISVVIMLSISLLPILIPSKSYNEAIMQFGNRLF